MISSVFINNLIDSNQKVGNVKEMLLAMEKREKIIEQFLSIIGKGCFRLELTIPYINGCTSKRVYYIRTNPQALKSKLLEIPNGVYTLLIGYEEYQLFLNQGKQKNCFGRWKLPNM